MRTLGGARNDLVGYFREHPNEQRFPAAWNPLPFGMNPDTSPGGAAPALLTQPELSGRE